jgi:hypothetical protein
LGDRLSLDSDGDGERGGGCQTGQAGEPGLPADALGPEARRRLGPPIASGPEWGEGLEPRNPLVQPLQLGLAVRALLKMRLGGGSSGLPARLPKAQQGLHG